MNIEPAGTNQVVTGAIRQAARMTGADFKYLLATAQVESNLNPNAQAPTSSAKGLFQFTEQTWLTTLKEQGTPLGYGPYASAIARQPSGEYAVADPRMTASIMNLRADPAANSLMAGAFTKINAGKLAERLGRDATEGELYLAHFLGSNGASRLIGLADSSPRTPAAAIFPSAARANPSIFYDGRGQARSANDVYRTLVSRYDAARGAPPPGVPAMIATGDDKSTTRGAFAPDTAAMTETYAAAARLASPVAQADPGPVFYGLFRSNGGEPVAPVVSSLWTSPPAVTNNIDGPLAAKTGAQTAAQTAGKPGAKPETRPATQPAPPASGTLATAAADPPIAPMGSGEFSLFQDAAPDTRALFRGRV